MDVEIGFIENHFDVMVVVEQVIRAILAYISHSYSSELAMLKTIAPQMSATFPHIHFRDAQALIYKLHGVDVRHEPDLSPQDERWLGAWAQAEYGSDFLFVTGYPMVKRPFYTHPDWSNPVYSNSFDLLFRGTELITGGQRLHVYSDYLAALDAAALPHAPFASYLEAFKYGMPPHGGFAIGLERLVMQLLGLPNVRLAALFPRDIGRLSP
jgi:nondiscriminating aspartyl-tRNA synthetase